MWINLLESCKGIVYIQVVTFAEGKLFSDTLLIDNKGLIANTLQGSKACKKGQKQGKKGRFTGQKRQN